MSKDKKNKEEKLEKKDFELTGDETRKPNNDKGQDSSNGESSKYKIVSQEKKGGQISLDIEMPFSELENKRSKAIEVLGKEVVVKGFRKGSAPAGLIAQEVGEAKIIEEMSYQSILSVLPKLIEEEKINPLTQPSISILKLAPGNPMVFKAVFVLMPEINVADYKKIAKSVKQPEDIKVEEAEIDEYIDYIRSQRAEAETLKKKTSADPKERAEANKKVASDDKMSEDKDGDVDKNSKNPKTDLPELNDEFVKTLGDFKDVSDFKKQLRENMEKDKKQRATQKRRLEIIEKIISESKIDVPDLMVEEELNKMLQQFKGDLDQAKMNFEDYLTQINKKEQDLLREWRPDAIKRTKMNLILPKIAVKEKIEADPEKVEHEVKHLKEHYPDIEDHQAKSYVSHMLRNDAVFKFLEEIK